MVRPNTPRDHLRNLQFTNIHLWEECHRGHWNINGKTIDLDLTDKQLLDIFVVYDQSAKKYQCNETSSVHRKNKATFTRPMYLLKHLKEDHFNIKESTNGGTSVPSC